MTLKKAVTSTWATSPVILCERPQRTSRCHALRTRLTLGKPRYQPPRPERRLSAAKKEVVVEKAHAAQMTPQDRACVKPAGAHVAAETRATEM
ncbi:hypothetical protein MRX96_028898 [Rhipicephalus microplus]